jgi:hypothetical protein
LSISVSRISSSSKNHLNVAVNGWNQTRLSVSVGFVKALDF